MATSEYHASSVASTPRSTFSDGPMNGSGPVTPAQPIKSLSSGLSSVFQVLLPPGTRIELLPRGKGDSTVRLAQNGHADLKAGMYVMAAVQGRTRISFYKLPDSVVRKELDRLQASGMDYGLVLTNAPPQSTPSAPPQLLTPSVFATPSMAFQANNAPQSSRAATNVVPSVSSARPSQEPMYKPIYNSQSANAAYLSADDGEFDDDGYAENELDGGNSDRLGELPSIGSTLTLDKAFLESVERLRSQRRAVEAIKRESQQKTLRIESLTAELRQVQQEVSESREAFESLRRAAATTQSLEEALALERNRNLKLEKDYERLRSEFKVVEGTSAEELVRIKSRREEEKVALQNALEETKLLHSEAMTRVEELKRSLVQSNQERDASEAREEQTRRAFERLAAEQKERDVKAEHTLERVRVERDKAMRRSEELESFLAVARGQVSALREGADATRERFAVLDRTVAELEENNRDLRAQLAEVESRTQSRIREYESELERVKRELESVLDVKDESRKAREELRAALDEEIRAHRASREELVAMEAAKREAEEGCERALRHAKTLNDRMTELSQQKDLLHDRLVRALAKGNALADELEEERRAAKTLAETRLELLSQFVEEERRLDGTLMMGVPSTAAQRRRAERKLEFASPRKTASSSTYMRRAIHETPDVLRSSTKGFKQ